MILSLRASTRWAAFARALAAVVTSRGHETLGGQRQSDNHLQTVT